MSTQGYTNMLEKYRDVDEDEIMSALSKDELARLENEIDREILEKTPNYDSYESESYTTATTTTDDSEGEEQPMKEIEEEVEQEPEPKSHGFSRGKPEAFAKGKLDKTQLKPVQKTLQRQKSKDKHTFKLPALKKAGGTKTEKKLPGQEANTELKDELIQAVKKRDKRRTKRVNSSGLGRRLSSGVPRPRRNSRVARYRDGNEHQVDAAIVNRNFITNEMLNLRPKLKKVQVKEPKLVLPDELHGVSFNRITAGARMKEEGEEEEEMEADPEPAVSEPAVSEDGNASRSSAFGYDADVDVTPSDDSYALPGEDCEMEEPKKRHKALSESSEAASDGVTMASTASTSAESCDVFGELSINPNSVEEMVERVRENDPTLTEVNLNNIHDVPIERFEELAEAMEDNTHVTSLALANTGLTDRAARALASMLKRNKTLKKLNIESNFITGEGGRRIVSALRKNNCLTELSLDNQRHIFGAKVEHEISKLLRENTSLLRFGYQFANPGPRMATSNILTKNMDLVRRKRVAEEKRRQHGGGSKRPQLRRQPSSEWYRKERLKKLHDTSKLLGLDPSKAGNKDVEKVLKNMNPEEISLLERWFTSKLLGVVDAPPSAEKETTKKEAGKTTGSPEKADENLLRPPARARRNRSPPASRDQLLDSIRKQNTKLKKVKLRPFESPSRVENTDSDVEARPLPKDKKNETPKVSRESSNRSKSNQGVMQPNERLPASKPKSPADEGMSSDSGDANIHRKNDVRSVKKPSTPEPIARKTPSPQPRPTSAQGDKSFSKSGRYALTKTIPTSPRTDSQGSVQVKPTIVTTEPSFDETSEPSTMRERTPELSSSEEMFTASDAETASHKSDDRSRQETERRRSPSPDVHEWKEGEEYDSDEYEIVEIEVTDSEGGESEEQDPQRGDKRQSPQPKSPEIPRRDIRTSPTPSHDRDPSAKYKSPMSARLAQNRPAPFLSGRSPSPGPRSPAQLRQNYGEASRNPHSITPPSASRRSHPLSPLSPPTPRSNTLGSPALDRNLSRTSNSSAESAKSSPRYTHPTPPRSSRAPRSRATDEDVPINPKTLSTIESFFSFK